MFWCSSREGGCEITSEVLLHACNQVCDFALIKSDPGGTVRSEISSNDIYTWPEKITMTTILIIALRSVQLFLTCL